MVLERNENTSGSWLRTSRKARNSVLPLSSQFRDKASIESSKQQRAWRVSQWKQSKYQLIGKKDVCLSSNFLIYVADTSDRQLDHFNRGEYCVVWGNSWRRQTPGITLSESWQCIARSAKHQPNRPCSSPFPASSVARLQQWGRPLSSVDSRKAQKSGMSAVAGVICLGVGGLGPRGHSSYHPESVSWDTGVANALKSGSGSVHSLHELLMLNLAVPSYS